MQNFLRRLSRRQRQNSLDNPAYGKAAEPIDSEATGFARQMGRGISMPAKDKVYVAAGCGIASTRRASEPIRRGPIRHGGWIAAGPAGKGRNSRIFARIWPVAALAGDSAKLRFARILVL